MLCFLGCSDLAELDLSNFDTKNMGEGDEDTMGSMFRDCSKLATIYVGPNWVADTKSIPYMFDGCLADDVTRKD